MPAAPSVILLGSKPGSLVALTILIERGWDVRCVVPAPCKLDKLDGETLAMRAASLGVRTMTADALADCEPVDYVISYMYRSLVTAPTRSLARQAAVNFHAAPLPGYGGWAFYNVAILDDASEYGCTCHHMDDGFDTGPIVEVRRFPIDAATETALSLERKAQREMIRLFVDFCRLVESGEPLPATPQDRAMMRYLTREQFEALKKVPVGADAETVQRHARAFWFPPYDGAYIEEDGSRVNLTPDGVENQSAQHLHADDLHRLEAVAAEYGEVPS